MKHVALSILIAFIVVACGGNDNKPSKTATDSKTDKKVAVQEIKPAEKKIPPLPSAVKETSPAKDTAQEQDEFQAITDEQQQADINKQANPDRPIVLLDTSYGKITVELDRKAAPKTVDNFLFYVDSGFYDGTIFHRVIKNFMIQGGGLTKDMKKKKTRSPVKLEADNGLKNVVGAIAMARTNDPDSATSQFFINTVDNKTLNYPGPYGGYTVFGKVIDGMDIVKKIESVDTGMSKGRQNVPLETVVINSFTR